MKVDSKLGALAQQQAGYIGHQQARELGLSAAAVRWRLAGGDWISVQRGLYRVAGIEGSSRQVLRAAVAILPNATASHQAASELHGLSYVKRGMVVVTVHARTTRRFPGVIVHRSLDLSADQRTRVGGIWSTTVARTLVDNAAVLRRRAMSLALDDALAAGKTTIDEVSEVLESVARRGRTGSTLMRSLLNERIGDDLTTATRLERVGMRVFVEGGLPRPEFQYPAPWNPNHFIDFAWPRWCLGCEADSRRWHTRVDRFQSDRNRDNLALLQGWRLLRFTWQDFTRRPQHVVNVVRTALAAAD